MQQVVPAQRGWRHWTGRLLPVLGVALLALGPAHAKDKKKKHHDAETPAQTQAPERVEPPELIEPPGRSRPPPVLMMREAPRAAPRVSLDRVIDQVQRRYKARVVKTATKESDGRVIYELRLLSEEGRVWTVKVDAETGKEV